MRENRTPRSRTGLALALVVIAAAWGCEDGRGVVHAVGLDRARSELADARNRWRAAGLDDYTYDFRLGTSLTPPARTARMRATVRDGELVGAIYLEDVEFVVEGDPFEAGDPVPDRVLQGLWTIPEWFDSIDGTIDREPLELEVRYHRLLGHPELYRGASCLCPDAGWRHRIERVDPLEGKE